MYYLGKQTQESNIILKKVKDWDWAQFLTLQSFRFPIIRNFRIHSQRFFITSIDFLYYMKLEISFLYTWTPSTLKLKHDLTYPKFSPWTECSLFSYLMSCQKNTLISSTPFPQSHLQPDRYHYWASLGRNISAIQQRATTPFQVSENI